MKILFYSPHPNLTVSAQTGYGTHMREMIRAFQELGHEVEFYIAGEEGSHGTGAIEWVKEERQSAATGVVKQLTPKILWETLRDFKLIRIDQQRFRRLKKICSSYQPDVIYERSYYGMTSGVRTAKLLDIHHILEVNSPNVQERIELSGPSFLSNRARKKDLWVIANSNHVLTVSTRLAEMLHIPELAANWDVTPNAIRPGQENESTQKRTRKEFGIPENITLVGFVGSIFPWHGVDLLIDAISNLKNRGVHAAAIIVGDGVTRKLLEQKVDDQGIMDRIFWTGSVPSSETYRLSELCDALIMPKSNEYGSPVKLFEYAMSRVPVIAPTTSPVLEIMENRVHGLLVEAEVEAIANAILEITDKPIGNALAENWRSRVLSGHTWQNNARTALKGQQSEASQL
jgi:glycosyltransferase involved in cell wall biosynthesis